MADSAVRVLFFGAILAVSATRGDLVVQGVPMRPAIAWALAGAGLLVLGVSLWRDPLAALGAVLAASAVIYGLAGLDLDGAE